jgi:nucleoside-diphosphate-sugar epimerase
MDRIVIFGCGFLGEAAAFLLQGQGHEVCGITSQEASAATLRDKGLAACALDFTDLSALQAWAAGNEEPTAWIHCASSGGRGEAGYESVFRQGLANLCRVWPSARGIFTSSTSVYAQTDGTWVEETSPATPDRATGKILRQAEDQLLNHGGVVLRLAGLYGPGRSVLLRRFLAGEAKIEGDGSRWINQIHRDDAASALAHAVGETLACGIYNLCDDQPMTQRDVFTEMARRLQQPLPPSAPPDLNRKRGWTNKRVANQKLRATGWQPAYSSFFDAWEQLLAAEQG